MKRGGCGDDSTVKGASCSSGGYRFGSQHPCQATHNCLQHQLQGMSYLLLASTGTYTHGIRSHIHTYVTVGIRLLCNSNADFCTPPYLVAILVLRISCLSAI